MRFGKAQTDVIVFATACAAGAVLRVWLATRGHNYDMDSWRSIADVAREHWNVYAATPRYNYGPVWFGALWVLDRVHDVLPLGRFGGESFHVVVASFLTLADLGIAVLLFRAFGLLPGLLFILNPVSVLLTGYHSQFDNLAVLPALGAWLLIKAQFAGAAVAWRRWMVAALLLGLSLATKHFLVFLPLWVLICPSVTRGRRGAFALTAWGVFALGFVPFLFTPGAAASIRDNVIGYANYSPNALMPSVIDVFAPARAVDSLFGLTPGFSVVRNLFHVLMVAAGWFVARRAAAELFACHLAAVLVFTSVINDQYLAIPLVACAIHWRRASGWVYTALAAAIVADAAYRAGALPGPPWWRGHLPGLVHRHAIAWLAVMLVGIVSGLRGWRWLRLRKS